MIPIILIILVIFLLKNKGEMPQENKTVVRLIEKYGDTPKLIERYIVGYKLFGKNIRVCVHLIPMLDKINDKYYKTGIKYNIKSIGGYNFRKVTGGKGLSFHAFGRALDFNPNENPYVKPPKTPMKSDMPVEFVRLFTDLGWRWGGNWSTVQDPMHFDYIADCI